ncbi:hypothetical protein [Candidatus Xianfuyuplasma coldseepsis]|uniref:Uncharacterized protein n=1 Tax=Candidatus Xianfuyuplasma coldseepsis TaxID=2782163 RepID=A0A7L7KR27_9MOLU|nr:hypothetical protein [Xianfuyuplasma coldseepsis]QMS84258.1 hypothetical protein G4Z02_00385 [Xianfuyuplasma coldseepsis]
MNKKIYGPILVVVVLVIVVLQNLNVFSLNYTSYPVLVGNVALQYTYENSIDTYEEYLDLLVLTNIDADYDETFFDSQFLVFRVYDSDSCKNKYRYHYDGDDVGVTIRHRTNTLACLDGMSRLHLIEVKRSKLDSDIVEIVID